MVFTQVWLADTREESVMNSIAASGKWEGKKRLTALGAQASRLHWGRRRPACLCHWQQ